MIAMFMREKKEWGWSVALANVRFVLAFNVANFIVDGKVSRLSIKCPGDDEGK